MYKINNQSVLLIHYRKFSKFKNVILIQVLNWIDQQKVKGENNSFVGIVNWIRPQIIYCNLKNTHYNINILIDIGSKWMNIIWIKWRNYQSDF